MEKALYGVREDTHKHKKEVLSQIKEIVNQYDPEAIPYLLSGYIFYDEKDGFFTADSRNKRVIRHRNKTYDGEKFDKVLHLLQKDFEEGMALLKEKLPAKYDSKRRSFTPEIELSDYEKQVLKYYEIAKEILAQEYKVHLMPKEEYMLPLINKIFDACKKDKELRSLIYGIKFLFDFTKVTKEEMPRIVIYPRLGKENAKRLIHKLNNLFEEYDLDEIAVNKIPRFNKKINSLIYYAQGGSDFKKEILAEYEEFREEFTTQHGRHYAWSKDPVIHSEELHSGERKERGDKKESREAGDRGDKKESRYKKPVQESFGKQDLAGAHAAKRLHPKERRPYTTLTTSKPSKPKP